jgi:hypothetical protein
MLASQKMSDATVSFDRYDAQLEKIAKGGMLKDFVAGTIEKESERVKLDQSNLAECIGDWSELRDALEHNVLREKNVNESGNQLYHDLKSELDN